MSFQRLVFSFPNCGLHDVFTRHMDTYCNMTQQGNRYFPMFSLVRDVTTDPCKSTRFPDSERSLTFRSFRRRRAPLLSTESAEGDRSHIKLYSSMSHYSMNSHLDTHYHQVKLRKLTATLPSPQPKSLKNMTSFIRMIHHLHLLTLENDCAARSPHPPYGHLTCPKCHAKGVHRQPLRG